jgi:SAM-dependent methyltransferase
MITRDPELWRRLWLEAKARSPVNRRELSSEGDQIEQWSRRAKDYARHTAGGENLRWRRQLLRWLEAEGALAEGMRVLDIGAGPGNFAVPLARRCREVVALDPAEGMLVQLLRGAARAGVSNVRPVCRRWEEIDLQQEGWMRGFDLVVASMTPGVSEPGSLEKMLAASRGFCYLSGWSGDRWGPWAEAQAALWPRIFAEELGDYPSDVLYPLGLLYALGFRPSVRFRYSEHLREMSPGEAAAGLEGHFARYTGIDDRVRRLVEAYVAEHTEGGVFRQMTRSCQGFLLWRVAPP